MKRRPRVNRGFTLLEILVALVIFVGSIAVISRLVSLGLDNVDYARLQSEGALLIENKFAEIDADITDSESGDGSDDSFPGWSCEMGTENSGDFLYKITATAKHTSGVTLTMTRFFFDESEAEEAAAAAASSSSSGGSTSSATGGSAAGGS